VGAAVVCVTAAEFPLVTFCVEETTVTVCAFHKRTLRSGVGRVTRVGALGTRCKMQRKAHALCQCRTARHILLTIRRGGAGAECSAHGRCPWRQPSRSRASRSRHSTCSFPPGSESVPGSIAKHAASTESAAWAPRLWRHRGSAREGRHPPSAASRPPHRGAQTASVRPPASAIQTYRACQPARRPQSIHTNPHPNGTLSHATRARCPPADRTTSTQNARRRTCRRRRAGRA
jgi:hypothetical protein